MLAPPAVELAVMDAFPWAQTQSAVRNWNDDLVPKERAFEMRDDACDVVCDGADLVPSPPLDDD
jgi:hypothetical protein